jgi:hypothetical protein
MSFLQVTNINNKPSTDSHKKNTTLYMGARGSVVVKALCYKPEGRGFETR